MRPNDYNEYKIWKRREREERRERLNAERRRDQNRGGYDRGGYSDSDGTASEEDERPRKMGELPLTKQKYLFFDTHRV